METDGPSSIAWQNVDLRIVIKDFQEFTGVSRVELILKITCSPLPVRDLWEKTVLTNKPSEIKKFYSQRQYIYEVLLTYLRPLQYHSHSKRWSNKTQTCLNILDYIQKNVGGSNILDFGGGPGQLALMMHFCTDKNVGYLDLKETEMIEFAKWRFKKYNADIEVIEAEVDHCDLKKNFYDFVVSDAALEHVLDLEATVKTIYDSLKKRGKFYLLFDEGNQTSHINFGKDWRKIMRHQGFHQSAEYVWVKNEN